MIARIKHVKQVRSKGRAYFYHRVTRERLPDDRDERLARALEINRTLKGTARKYGQGSLANTIAQYKRAPEYRNLRPKTQRDYATYLDTLHELWGPHPVQSIERKHVLALRDEYAETPSKANMLVTVLRLLLAFAVDRDLRIDNPAKEVKRLPTGEGHSAWPSWAIERFLETASPMMALALKIGLYTGQREGDCLSMSWHDYDGEQIHVVQGKTGAKLWIPVHTALKDALDKQPKVSPLILTTETGKPFTGSNFRHHFGKAMKTAGLERLTFHGLRYTAAATLAEAGASLKEIAAVTGHKSLAMLQKYSREADQKRLARAAIVRLEKNAAGTKSGKPR